MKDIKKPISIRDRAKLTVNQLRSASINFHYSEPHWNTATDIIERALITERKLARDRLKHHTNASNLQDAAILEYETPRSQTELRSKLQPIFNLLGLGKVPVLVRTPPPASR